MGRDQTVSTPSQELGPALIRVKNETATLILCMLLVGLILFVLIGITVGMFLVLICVMVIIYKVQQSGLFRGAVRVTENQLPQVFGVAKAASSRLCMNMPDLFVKYDPMINAYAIGFSGRQSICLHSATVESLDDMELAFVIGHELTHIKCSHTTWLPLTQTHSVVQIPLLSFFTHLALLAWSRKAELTCDQGGLLACRDVRSAVSALVKFLVGPQLAQQVNSDALLDQHLEHQHDLLANISELFGNHPTGLRRVAALLEFSNSTAYRELCMKIDSMHAAG